MTQDMKKYLERYNDERICKNELNEWYVRCLPIEKQIDCMEDHEEMWELFSEAFCNIVERLEAINRLDIYNNGGFGDWANEPAQITRFVINNFFPLESIKDGKYVDWIKEYRELTEDWLEKLVVLRQRYNGDLE